jgi:predicted dehydrogenase
VQRPGQKVEVMPLPRLNRIDRWGSLAEFASAIRGRREPESSGRANLGSIALMVAAVESTRRHRPVRVPTPLD